MAWNSAPLCTVALLKCVPQDFIVQEVQPDGTICDLTPTPDVPDIPAELTVAAMDAAEAAAAQAKAAAQPDIHDEDDLSKACELCVEYLPRGALAFARKACAAAAAEKSMAVPENYTKAWDDAGIPESAEDTPAIFDMPIPEPLLNDKQLRGALRAGFTLAFPLLCTQLARPTGAPANAPWSTLQLCRYAGADDYMPFFHGDDAWSAVRYLNMGQRAGVRGITVRVPADKDARSGLFIALRTRGVYLDTKLLPAPEGEAGDSAWVPLRLQFTTQRQAGDKRKRAQYSNAGSRLGTNAWVHATLVRCGWEQHHAFGAIAQGMRLPGTAVLAPGIKDKVALTSQRIALKARAAGKLLAAVGGVNRKNRRGAALDLPDGTAPSHASAAQTGWMRVGDFCYSASGVKVGGLIGNRFTITLRRLPEHLELDQVLPALPSASVAEPHMIEGVDAVSLGGRSVCEDFRYFGPDIDALFAAHATTGHKVKPAPARGKRVHLTELPDTELESMAASFRSTGYLNLFGTQRVGSGWRSKSYAAPDIGAALLGFDYVAAVHRMCAPRPGGAAKERRARRIWAQSCLKQAGDTATPCGAAAALGNPAPMLDALPRNAREAHATLKALRVVGKSLRELQAAAATAIGQVPFAQRVFWTQAYTSHLWNLCADARLSLYGKHVVEGDVVAVNETSDEGITALQAKQLVLEHNNPPIKYVTVTSDDVASARYAPTHVVMPIASPTSMLPLHAVSAVLWHAVKLDGTHALLWPSMHNTDAEAAASHGQEAVEAAERRAEAAARAADIAAKFGLDELPGIPEFAIVAKWLSPGAVYRHVFVAPSDVAWQRVSVPRVTVAALPAHGLVASEHKFDDEVPDTEQLWRLQRGEYNAAGECEPALQWQFTLPSGCYATEALAGLSGGGIMEPN